MVKISFGYFLQGSQKILPETNLDDFENISSKGNEADGKREKNLWGMHADRT